MCTRSSSWPAFEKATSRRCVTSVQQPGNFLSYATGSRMAAVRWLLWRAQALTGSPCTTSLRSANWMPWWWMPTTWRLFQGVRRMWRMPSGLPIFCSTGFFRRVISRIEISGNCASWFVTVRALSENGTGNWTVCKRCWKVRISKFQAQLRTSMAKVPATYLSIFCQAKWLTQRNMTFCMKRR